MEKVVIVTGAARGLGSETARRFGTTGAKVVLNDIPKAKDAAEKISKEINKGAQGNHSPIKPMYVILKN